MTGGRSNLWGRTPQDRTEVKFLRGHNSRPPFPLFDLKGYSVTHHPVSVEFGGEIVRLVESAIGRGAPAPDLPGALLWAAVRLSADMLGERRAMIEIRNALDVVEDRLAAELAGAAR